MGNVKLVVFDFDKTLSAENMVNAILAAKHGNQELYWGSVKALSAAGVPPENAWIRQLLEAVHLDAHVLREVGESIPLYPGVLDAIQALKTIAAESGTRLYTGVITAGLQSVVEASPLATVIDFVVGSKLGSEDGRFSFVKDLVTSRTKAEVLINLTSVGLPEIGVGDVAYLGDGFSDVEAFGVVGTGGGATLGVYNPNDPDAQIYAESLLKSCVGLQAIRPASYGPEGGAFQWLKNWLITSSILANPNQLVGRL